MLNSEIEILLIEDNPHEAELTIRSLKKHNLTNKLKHIEDGAEALDFIFAKGSFSDRSVQNKPKLILLDLKLPKVDGLEILRAVKADDRTNTIPVVVLTSSREDMDIKTCYRLGANSYIVKPVEFDVFAKTVAELGMYWLFLNEPPIKR